jgi:hypothetical protein
LEVVGIGILVLCNFKLNEWVELWLGWGWVEENDFLIS